MNSLIESLKKLCEEWEIESEFLGTNSCGSDITASNVYHECAVSVKTLLAGLEKPIVTEPETVHKCDKCDKPALTWAIDRRSSICSTTGVKRYWPVGVGKRGCADHPVESKDWGEIR